MHGSRHSPSKNPTRRVQLDIFHKLSTEIVVSVLSFLSWKDLLSVRKVSPYLQDASKTKSLWTSLFLHESKAKFNAPCLLRLELPMSMYSSGEIERILLRWKTSRSAWRRGEVQRRNIIRRPIAHAMAHLLKGGRWLLRLLVDGSLVCHDLDHPQDEAINIAAPVFSSLALSDNTAVAVMSVQELDDSPVLAARVAVLYSVAKKHAPTWSQDMHRVDIWSLTVALDDSTQPKGNLAAKRITSFPLPSEFQIAGKRSVTLLDNEIATNFSYALAPHGPVFLTVIDWTKPDGRSTSYPRRYVAGPTAKDAGRQGILVGNSLIFTRYQDTLFLISYARSQETNALPHRDCADGKRVWQGYTGLFAGQTSAPFFCTTSTRIVIQCHREIMGVIVKRDQAEATEVVQLMSLPSRNLLDQTHLGYHHAVFFPDRMDASTVALSFCWPDEKGNAVSVPFTSQHKILARSALNQTALCREHYFRVLFDEGSGRIITLSAMKGKLVRWETSPLA
ncbi:hypothetical protein D9619_009619 [Psilocybe cf. subviscida]|uniref:F-box domain-containing protein n=1 Tax=Psilocybe cf. subviscida TaxID=2480587 RepID=A0A8H5BNG4_9AGAR|nr:hypothetical protein D9619_009619 [Psilocybe cf. subviscida]